MRGRDKMISGDQTSSLKGYVRFDPNIVQGDKGKFTYVVVNQFKYKDNQGKKHYQPVKCLFQGVVVEKMVEPYVRKGTHLDLWGEFIITYELDQNGYPDLRNIKDAYFRVDRIAGMTQPSNNQGQNQDGQPGGGQGNQGGQSRGQGNQNRNQGDQNRSQGGNQSNNNRQQQDPFGGNYQGSQDPFGGNSGFGGGSINISDDDLPF